MLLYSVCSPHSGRSLPAKLFETSRRDAVWSDWGLRRALWWFSLLLQPHAVVVPGDMLDEGKRCDDSQHEQLLQRFKAVFQAHKSDQWHMMLPLSSHPIPLILTPGNHDSPPPSAPRPRLRRARSTGSLAHHGGFWRWQLHVREGPCLPHHRHFRYILRRR